MKIQTANTILYCARWQETVAFYKTGLQLKITASFDWFVEFALNERARLSIADVTRSSLKTCAGQGITIALEVEDIGASHLFLKQAGHHPQAIRDHAWGAEVFYIYDPEGNRLEFWSPKKRNTGESPASQKG
ncbi:MAG: VOC family protein [Desulforhopalus sp.]|nr:VOC family protein [Desulforhopalus sp.]